MRVALVAKRLARSGGSERQVWLTARALTAQGVSVHLFCQQVRSDAPADVTLHRMPRLPLGRGLAGRVFGAWARRAVRHHGPFDLSQAFGRTLGQDVVRFGGGCHRTYLEHAHGLDRPPWLRPLLRALPGQRRKLRLEQAMLEDARTRAVITNSCMARDDLVFRYDADPGRFHVLRNGVDLQRFAPVQRDEREALRRAQGLPADAPVALFLGNGYARKGLDPTLRALARLAVSRPSLRLLVAGADRRARFWRRRARDLGLGSHVLFLGPCAEVEQLYPLANVYVLPTAYDAAANSTLEALACGLPVVTSAMNGAGEILPPDGPGTVVPTPVHPGDLADAMARWLDDPDPAETARRARGLAGEHPAEGAGRSLIDLYQALLGVSGPGRPA